ncbi:DUF2752 domain-containing protein [Mucilaginibacter sp. UR6-1]|uniref:DUF2752 domain-containing protein n=1 Tax=Mucilaginibacter sp. UR6-1 TaxID=1435643 RepID=UPI001E389172|nr:DUF2752 domain-containing protein [Mucilaginibacter sp. UR6-1]MCC8410941.1 DUF2752 domain-containing protein [Mucilaginibacter sp. UR6-1]
MIKKLFAKYFELTFWVAAIIALAVTNPAAETHFSLCPLKIAGIGWCPGCGLGHSISWLLRGNISNSFNAHWFGIPALGIILWRVFTLTRARLSNSNSFV